jgi:hypothetical protein
MRVGRRFSGIRSTPGCRSAIPPGSWVPEVNVGGYFKGLDLFVVDLSRDGDRKLRGSFDQGKPAGCSGVGDWLGWGGVNSVL